MDVAVPYGRAARSAAVKATLWMADGGVGLLDARIDFTAGTVRGSYRRDGETNYIAVDRNGAPLP